MVKCVSGCIPFLNIDYERQMKFARKSFQLTVVVPASVVFFCIGLAFMYKAGCACDQNGEVIFIFKRGKLKQVAWEYDTLARFRLLKIIDLP